ncbi:unnamed protein product [Cylicocyclus nassatus]|uniref:Uncharacterized protein n=1 Tax=Cylicocyclus nassatus TaxID=53992 RepID=A0AA36GU63_CYLNA|nr:unnamed protein product [Cylicocyclus nassatus]
MAFPDFDRIEEVPEEEKSEEANGQSKGDSSESEGLPSESGSSEETASREKSPKSETSNEDEGTRSPLGPPAPPGEPGPAPPVPPKPSIPAGNKSKAKKVLKKSAKARNNKKKTKDLPVGFMFTTILSSFNNADKFKMEINVSSRSSFLACVQFSKSIGADVLSTRGLSVLYSKDNDQSVMAVTIAVRVVRYYHSPTLEKVITTRDGEAQTERVEMRTVQTQVQPSCTNAGSNTELHLLSENELESTVASVVAQHLEDMKTSESKKKEQRNAEKNVNTRPIQVPMQKAEDLDLGKNVVPRLQKLRVLDKMIGERAAVVEQFDESLVKMEIAKKREFIRKSRNALADLKAQREASKSAEMLEAILRRRTPQRPKSRDAATQSERPPSSEEQSQSSSSRTSSTSTSTSDASMDEEGQATESSSTASTRSSSSSKETILRKNSNSTTSSSTQPTVRNQEQADDAVRQQRNQAPAEAPPLSPTSLYLKQLREKILQERMQKV